MEPFNNTPLAKVNRLYSDYRNAGFDKSTILRKLKAQFSSAKFSFKGATLYVAFGDNPAQKVTGGLVETNAATRLLAADGAKLTRNELFKRAANKGYRITEENGKKTVQMNRYTGLVFYPDGTIHLAGVSLDAVKNLPLKEAFRILKLA